MIKIPPQEKQWLSWLYVVVWTLIIFMTIPLARAIQQFVYQEWSRDLFTYVVLALTLMGFLAAVNYIRQFRSASRSNIIWLAAVTGIFIVYTIQLGKMNPEEAIHFVQYGVLGILVYRALAHRLHDSSIYLVAAVICGIIGLLDEFTQWLTPGRFWGLRDIWMNFFSAAVVQIAIAKGLKPKFINGRPGPTNLLFLIRLMIAAVAIMGANMLLTPPRIAGLANWISWLEFLSRNEGVMLEYGYLYEVPEIGVFRSRFAPEDLKKTDLVRGVEAAEILDRFPDKSSYRPFLKIYTPITDPFVHEARVHLFRRDAYFTAADKYKAEPQNYAERLTVAYRENQILERYFPETLKNSDHLWRDEKKALTRSHLLDDKLYDSRVSQNLITQVSEGQVACLFIIIILGLILLHRHIGKKLKIENSEIL